VGAPLHQLGSSSESITSSSHSSIPWNFALIHALGGKTVKGQELVVRRPDGTHAILLSSAAPIRMNERTITEAIIVFQDITVQKTIEHQKSIFLTMVNHELRTPLTAVLGFSDLLQEQEMEGLSPVQAHAIANIVKQGESLKYLVDEILDHSSLEHDVFALNIIYQDLVPLLTQAVERAAQMSKGHQILLNVNNLSTTRLMGWFDQQRIAQILNNLLTNAIKYSPTGEVIELGAHPDTESGDYEVLLWVKDHGPGIASDDLPHIFERFYRAQKRDLTVSGLGLGLYIAKEVVQRHGGRIWVESTEGVGSTFFLALPMDVVRKRL
jgi:signal transduction histidine kinase